MPFVTSSNFLFGSKDWALALGTFGGLRGFERHLGHFCKKINYLKQLCFFSWETVEGGGGQLVLSWNSWESLSSANRSCRISVFILYHLNQFWNISWIENLILFLHLKTVKENLTPLQPWALFGLTSEGCYLSRVISSLQQQLQITLFNSHIGSSRVAAKRANHYTMPHPHLLKEIVRLGESQPWL